MRRAPLGGLYELAFIQKARPAAGAAALPTATCLYELAFIQKARHGPQDAEAVGRSLYELAFIQKARRGKNVRGGSSDASLYELAFIQKARHRLGRRKVRSAVPL